MAPSLCRNQEIGGCGRGKVGVGCVLGLVVDWEWIVFDRTVFEVGQKMNLVGHQFQGG